MENKIKEMEDRISIRMKKLERELDGIGKRIEEKVENMIGSAHVDNPEKKDKSSGAGLFWGMVFLGAGVIWLGNNLGWFYADVPWVAVGLIAGGLTLIVRNMSNTKHDEDM